MKGISQKLLEVFLVEHHEHVAKIRALLRGPAPLPPAALEELIRRAHTLKGAARTVDLAPVETLAHRLESVFELLREGALMLDPAVGALIERALEATEDTVAAVTETHSAIDLAPVLREIDLLLAVPRPDAGPRPEHAPAVALVQPYETVRVRAEDVDRLLRSSTQLQAVSQDLAHVTRQLGQLARQAHDLEHAWDRFRGVVSSVPSERKQPDGDRWTRRLDLFEERTRSISRQARSALRSQQRSAWTISLLLEQLEQDTARVRMVPAEAIFDAFRKMVRDLARDEGKEVEFRIEGLDVQADRLVLQALKDPVMHLLRNAVCHGIEPPQRRSAAGKNPAGRIFLRLETRRDRLNVTVQDDGQGIDLAAVADAAARRGLISPEAASSQSPEQLARLILEPGLSTARSVTPLSGRGMGLSVVQERVRQLQGEVRLQCPAGVGTSVLLSVPLSVSRRHIVLVECDGETFAVPAHAIERLCRLRAEDVQAIEGEAAISFQGQAAPLAKLGDLLEPAEAPPPRAPKKPAPPGPSHLPAVIMRSGERRLALVVDALLDERNAVVKDLGLKAADAGASAGGVLLEDGKVAVVLNPAELWEAFGRFKKSPGLQPAPEPRPMSRPTILVVDDSITTRSLEKSILEAHGYRVQVAVDGMEALERLRAEKADLVIADIVMPRLDGFGLLEQMKRESELAEIPVIVVSSLERGEDQRRGLALGANAYIVKRKFDQQELLEAVRQLI